MTFNRLRSSRVQYAKDAYVEVIRDLEVTDPDSAAAIKEHASMLRAEAQKYRLELREHELQIARLQGQLGMNPR